LYHYTKRETAIEKIFLDGTIRMGRLTLTNDPQESAVGHFAIGTNTDEEVDLWAVLNRCKYLTTQPVRLACFTQDEHDPQIAAGLRGFEHDRMWAQYAGQHTGVCIEFDMGRLTASVYEHFRKRMEAGKGQLIHGSVQYVNKFSLGNGLYFAMPVGETSDEAIKRKRNEYAEQRYLRKSIDWISEQEYRFVWIDADDDYDADGDFVSIQGCVKSVFLGTLFPKPYRIIIKEICEAYGIKPFQMTYDAGHQQFVPLSWKREGTDQAASDGAT